MKTFIAATVLTLCAMTSVAFAEPNTLSWWLMPDVSEDLPHEVEEDNLGNWTELWVRPNLDSETPPTTIMEQSLGLRWIGMNPDKSGNPGKVTLVLAGRRIIDFSGDQVRTGTIDDDKIAWNDGKDGKPGTKSSLYEFKRRHRRRGGRRRAPVHFEKVALPPVGSRTKNLPNWSVERLTDLLGKIPNILDKPLSSRDLSAVAQIADPNGSLLGFRYGSTCDMKARGKVEDALADIEPKITCWMEQNKEGTSKLLATLLQHPTIECKPQAPMTQDHCAMASVPYVDSFFVKQPQLFVALNRCDGELGNTLLHEVFHLAGIKEDAEALGKAVEESESCGSYTPELAFDNESEGFLNDFQVQTRIFLFKKVREDATEKWGWSEGEKAFVLGSICNKMGDKYCARNYFQKAADANLQGDIDLPEGGDVPWSSVAQYQLFDSITEEVPRMHELVKYLHRDSNGTLLRRNETGIHRLHEFFVARQSLQDVQSRKGSCGSDIDEHVLCEDLAQIIKTPWFKNP